jgi:tRNA threonylcarbamoyladenosine biosynthesis protein TsaE
MRLGRMFELYDEAAMDAFGGRLAAQITGRTMLTLSGDLGAGKTTLARGILRGLGHHGNVKSPTYTVIEPYDLPLGRVYHFDLYRLNDPEELEFLGFRDYLNDGVLCMLEWPEKGAGYLDSVDLAVVIDVRRWGRKLELAAYSDAGEVIIQGLSSAISGEAPKSDE